MTAEKAAIMKAAKTVHGVFDQKSLMAGAGLLLKIMRQFSSIYETKQFYLVKNGQVGWISAYVDQSFKINKLLSQAQYMIHSGSGVDFCCIK